MESYRTLDYHASTGGAGHGDDPDDSGALRPAHRPIEIEMQTPNLKPGAGAPSPAALKV